MKHSKISVGLDIGTTKIVAMVGDRNEFGKVEILGIGKSKSLGVHRGVVNNITQTIQSIQQAVEEAKVVSGQEIDEVVVGIAGQHIRSLQHSDYITRTNAQEVISQEDVERLIQQVYKLVMLPGEEIIHVLPQEYKVDGQAEIKEPIGMYGGRLEANFHVVVGQVSSIKNIGRCVKSAGLSMGNITLEPLASSEAVLSQEEKEAGVALIDIGGGTTEVAVISLAGIVYSDSARIGGDKMDDSITEYIKQKYNLLIGERTAEEIKINIGSAYIKEDPKSYEVRGRDLVTGIPKTLILGEEEILEALSDVCAQIVKTIRNALESTPPELAADIVDRGIVMAGGGSLLSGMDDLLRQEVGLPIFLADDPLTSVAIGTGKVLDEIDLLATIELAS